MERINPLHSLQQFVQKLVSFSSIQTPRSITTSTTASSPALKMARGAVIALSHGGGPMPILGDPNSANLIKSLKTRVPAILKLDHADPAERPRAIVMVTAHWSTRNPTISSGAKHALLYDYYGFPAEAYKLKYDAPGSPEIASRLAELMKEEGLAPELDAKRGWDHGVFVPLLLVRPEADIPVVQVSVLESEDPAAHFAIGRALGKLREENVAIVGSGFATFHNLRHMFSGATGDPSFKRQVLDWSKAVTENVSIKDAKEREEKLAKWREWPGAYVSHPRNGAEHFLPLVVCAGAVGDEQAKLYADDFMGLGFVSYYWE
ncbi:extradiol ring-cleavage class 3 subunit B [Cercophora scortea]|uniref:Extradiol ring-cleavage class 3 subunit B n=1 Tax=Cercophora scortea TaxID=314031 RepID=A0AAE0J6F1_9PEZI|nr:extradiol ring-cleavage class 3 subunit B [Cercophora scortea]